MIDSKELRSGNWVLGKPISIPRMDVWSNGETRLTAYGIYSIEAGIMDANPYKPILLTPEVLVKCGFVNEYGSDYVLQIGESYTTGTMFFRLKFLSKNLQFSQGLGGENCTWVMLPIPTTLHQLQNLYFALTSEELNYQP